LHGHFLSGTIYGQGDLIAYGMFIDDARQIMRGIEWGSIHFSIMSSAWMRLRAGEPGATPGPVSSPRTKRLAEPKAFEPWRYRA